MTKTTKTRRRKAATGPTRKPDRFERARGTAQVKWRTDELMALLRDNNPAEAA